jgi:hypothetical protein
VCPNRNGSIYLSIYGTVITGIIISPEAEGKISTNPSLMELFPQISE